MALLCQAKLDGARLCRANLSVGRGETALATDLTEVSLQSADLSYANLTGAILKKANLKNADLTGANLDGADLTKAIMPDGNIY